MFTDPALDDLRRAGPVAAALLLGRLRLLDAEPDAGAPWSTLAPATGCSTRSTAPPASSTALDRRRRVTVREVWVDGVRTDGEAYAEALERVRPPTRRSRSRWPDPPAARPAHRRPARSRSDRLRAPVPDWLADALVTRGGP